MSVPADHSTTVQTIGLGGVAKMIVKAGFNYRHTMGFYLRQGRIKELDNFLYTKTLVPTGEGSGELAYYFIGSILQAKPEWAPYPKYIEIEITSRCNKRCIMCEHTHWHEPARDLTLKEFVSLTDQFDLRWVNLTGEGDAFLNKDYLQMIEHLKHRKTSVFLVDSFDLINEQVSERLVRAGVDGIYISMDGATKKTYETIKVGNNFDKVRTNIQSLLAWKKKLNSPIPEICFRFVITNINAHEMGDYVKLIRTLAPRHDWGDGSKIHFAGLLDFPEVHHLYMERVPQQYILEAVAEASHPDSLPAVFAHTQSTTNPSMNQCLAWMEPYFALVPYHMALPCCAVLMSNSRAKLADYAFGDYTKESFKSIWNHPYYRWFRKSVTDPHAKVPQLCAGCRAYDTIQRMTECGVDHRTRQDFE